MTSTLGRCGIVIVRTIFTFLAVILSGCVGVQLKQLEIRQLQTESAALSQTTEFLATEPALGGAYEGRVFVRGDAFNRFLAGLDNYDVPLEWPRGAVVRFEQSRLEFKDGPPTAIIQAKAVDGSGTIEVKVRIRADLLITANQEKDQLEVRYAVREILPDIRFSIFRWREFWLGMAILTTEAQKYVDAMPLTSIPLRPDVPINVDPPGTNRIDVNNGKAWIEVDQTLPHFKLNYSYRITKAITLQDGIHVFFILQRKA